MNPGKGCEQLFESSFLKLLTRVPGIRLERRTASNGFFMVGGTVVLETLNCEVR